jgi:hypothetical protein
LYPLNPSKLKNPRLNASTIGIAKESKPLGERFGARRRTSEDPGDFQSYPQQWPCLAGRLANRNNPWRTFMDAAEKANRLKDMLSQIAPAGIESVAKPPPMAANLALESTGPVVDHGTNAESGLSKLAQNRPQDLTGAEVFALEAIVMPQNRPVVRSRQFL